MKQTLKILSLLAAMLTLAGCDPDEMFNTERDITYTVSEKTNYSEHPEKTETTTVHLKTEAEWQALLDRFCDWAEGGSTVTFHRVGTQRAASASGKGIALTGHALSLQAKDAVEYSTTSREEMKRWMALMEDEGKTVTVSYDPATGTWNGTAYATAPQQPAQGGVKTYVNMGFNEMSGGMNVIVTIDSANHTAYVNFDYGNYALHMPCGRFGNIYEENGRMILAVWESTNGNDTLFVGRNYEGSLMICLAYSGICPANHTHECLLVPAPSDLQTWYCSSPYDIILNLSPYAIETYPEIGIAQICAPMATDINCIPAFWTGNCEMIRYFTNRTDVDYELSLRYAHNNDSSYYVVDSLGVTGYPSDATTAMPMVIHDLHQYPGCASQYVFNRIN